MHNSIFRKKELKKWIDGSVALRRHPGSALLPKPFKSMRGMLLAFLTLIRSIKQACFAASH